MKLFLIFALFQVQAFANDGSTPYIKVDSVTKDKRGDFEIKGGDAYKLYQVLGRDFVYDVSRSLTITSSKNSVSIHCKQNEDPNNEQKGIPSTTSCTFRFGKAFDPDKSEGDNYVWEGPSRDPSSLSPKKDPAKKK